ncbi:MAG: protein phosphatase 2C domain-containing protein [Muribaculaceae bacterium]|nr:protein phosphatase 2C domain-containing protein [Muribaculaceae bacterium]
MKNLTFRLVAVTEAAGKYRQGAVRDGNEDALYADLDLAGTANASTVPDSNVSPGNAGALFVVADGMGGMNAGEVASQIAVDTVRAAFQSQYLTENIISSPESRAQYMEDTIRRANDNIIREAAANPERSGMGSTLIMAWLMPDGQLTISWIGDSRAYVFNKKIGIHSLSEDHSLVQQLVRNGLITYEQSFDHPQNNVILRSLGDASQPCQPETRQYHVGKGDILLLCSDGLSGVLRDRPGKDPATGKSYPEQNIQNILSAYSDSMTECKNALWRAAELGGWYDNVTTILCSIVDGPASQVGKETALYEKELASAIRDAKGTTQSSGGGSKKWIYIAILAILAVAAIASFFIMPDSEENKMPEETPKAAASGAVSSEDVAEEPQASPINQPVAPTREPSSTPKPSEQKQAQPASAKPKEVKDAQSAANAVEKSQGSSTIGDNQKLKPNVDPNPDKRSLREQANEGQSQDP